MNTITKEFPKEELIALALAEIAARRFMIESGTYGSDVVEFYRRKLVLSKISLASLEAGPVVTFYRDGIEAAAIWVDKLRDAYDSEHGRHDHDTGDFEFGNDAQRDYSATLEKIAERIRALHPNAENSLAMSDSAPIYQVQYGNDWCDVERAQYDDHAVHGSPVRVVYTAPPVPGELVPTTSTDI
ncbi:hypothetical protein AB6I73_000028 [Citrobacter amalonaticus]|uniref:hypothetical protein n=1 Tax=Citrobacter TaxID=544 RepID=UPI001C531681|nr:hypothetical protein [Citrobacter amalonaticus]MBW0868597.1 hypothetical protein [Citrobacter amalonaticus]QZA38277.1 hypothetical protein K1713_09940 [Citrobacter amalonaticus]